MLEFLRRVVDDGLFLSSRAVSSLGRNASLALLSLALSLSIWLYVNDSQNPRQTDFFPGSVPLNIVNVPAGRAVSSQSDNAVSVRVSAPRSVFDNLTADDFTATVDLSGANARDVRRPVRVQARDRRVHVLEASPADVDVTLENVTSRTVPVEVHTLGAVPLGFNLSSTSVDPTSVTVSGPESLVQTVAAACAELNLTNLRQTVDFNVQLKAQGSHCGDITGVSLAPEDVRATVDVSQTVFTKAFVVTPTVRGEPASGYAIAAVSADPPLVQISAPLDVLGSIDAVRGVTTDDVNVAGARGGERGPQDVVQVVKLQLPQGATAYPRDDVTVHVTIAPQQGQVQFSVVPQIQGLADNLRAILVPDTVRVTLSGPLPILTALDPAAIGVHVDLDGLGAGLHSVAVTIDPPSGLTVAGVDPQQVGVALSPK